MRPRRTPSAPAMLVALDPDASATLQQQLYAGLRDAILAGRLAAGAQLPATRLLAAELSVSRTTVALAFDQLRAEGYVTGRPRSGTFVAATIPDRTLAVSSLSGRGRRGIASANGRTRLAEARVQHLQSPQPGLSARGERLAGLTVASATAPWGVPRAFRVGLPAIDAFPAALWARLTARRWRRPPAELSALLAYGAPAGYWPLREAIAAYVTTARGGRCAPEQVIVVGGAQQALDLVARVLLDPGDQVWMEDPGYLGARSALQAAGAGVVAVPVDGEGLGVGEGERRAPNARLAYVSPSHQFPLGGTMSAARRLQLLAWAARAGAWIVEDDYDSEFRYASRPLPSLQGMDVTGGGAPAGASRVVYVGTFSKTLFPALRLGYLVAPPALAEAFAAARSVADRHAPTMEQAVLADFIAEGHFARHVRRMRALYAERQAALLDAAECGRLGEHLELRPADAGMHLMGWLRERRGRAGGVPDDRERSTVAVAAGIEAPPLSRYALVPPARGALLLGYAAFAPPAIRRAADQLAAALAAR